MGMTRKRDQKLLCKHHRTSIVTRGLLRQVVLKVTLEISVFGGKLTLPRMSSLRIAQAGAECSRHGEQQNSRALGNGFAVHADQLSMYMADFPCEGGKHQNDLSSRSL